MKNRFSSWTILPLTLLLGLLASCRPGPELKDGDIIFQRSNSRQAQAIALATHSDYTHMGIVFFEAGVPFVYEAIQPVCKTPLKVWITRGEGGRYIAKRLKDSSALNIARLLSEVNSMMGKDYDWLFEWTDDRIYCSELVWKAYLRATGLEIGRLRTLGNFNLAHPAVRQLMKERYGDNVPLKMSVIAPCDIFESSLLVTVKKVPETTARPQKQAARKKNRYLFIFCSGLAFAEICEFRGTVVPFSGLSASFHQPTGNEPLKMSAQRFRLDPRKERAKEPVDNEAACGFKWDPTGLQVEELLLVDRAVGRTVGAPDIVVQNFQSGH